MRAGQRDGRGGELARGGHRLLPDGPVPLALGDDRGGHRGRQQDDQRGQRGGHRPHGPAPLPDVLTDQGVFGQLADGGGQIGHRVLEPRVGGPEAVRLRPGPAHVNPARFLLERVPQRLLGQGGAGRPVQVACAGVPDQLTAGDRDEDAAGRPVLAPPADLLGHPGRLRRLRGGHQDQPARAVQGLLDRGPQVRGRGQAGLVPEHPQRAYLVPGLGEVLQLGLQPGRDGRVEPVAVGDERVVAPLLGCHHDPPGAVCPDSPGTPRSRRALPELATGYRPSHSG